jgi:hypothetical protein
MEVAGAGEIGRRQSRAPHMTCLASEINLLGRGGERGGFTVAVSGKYGKISIPRVGEDEPVFILRAQDRLAEGIVEIYKVIASLHDSPLVKELDKEIERFRKWKGPRKMPD